MCPRNYGYNALKNIKKTSALYVGFDTKLKGTDVKTSEGFVSGEQIYESMTEEQKSAIDFELALIKVKDQTMG